MIVIVGARYPSQNEVIDRVLKNNDSFIGGLNIASGWIGEEDTLTHGSACTIEPSTIVMVAGSGFPSRNSNVFLFSILDG